MWPGAQARHVTVARALICEILHKETETGSRALHSPYPLFVLSTSDIGTESRPCLYSRPFSQLMEGDTNRLYGASV